MFPILFRLGSLNIYAYGFFIAIGFVLGSILAIRRGRQESISDERIVDLLFLIVISAIVGSRLLFVLVNLEHFRDDPLQIFRIWEGGLVFYGGLLLAVAISFGYLRWNRLPVWKFADLFSPSIALGLFFGRLGCFFAGCCYGKETFLPWGTTFIDPNSLARLNISLHPTQVYEALGSLAIFFFLNWMRRRKTFEGQIFYLFLLLYSSLRFMIEFLRDDPRGFFFGGIVSTSQGIGIFLALTSLFMLFYLKRAQRR
ncbi:MAG: prolipoprotein diacylglyceryl transferase [Deltaproteobacteria bacterium]|nr:prolipoprotein diacylglyceryl transferase [Deltaproteobacteria bacterium]